MMLKYPLDSGFRDSVDREEQERNFVSAYKAYDSKIINLLTAMVIPIDEEVNSSLDEKEFENYFNRLKPGEQARCAILMQKLEQGECDLSPLTKGSLHYAGIAAQNAKKLSSGDQIELLKAFRSLPGLSYEDVLKKTLKGKPTDRYNAGIKLAELERMIQRIPPDEDIRRRTLDAAIYHAVTKLNPSEMKSFDLRHHELIKQEQEKNPASSMVDRSREVLPKPEIQVQSQLSSQRPSLQEASENVSVELDKMRKEVGILLSHEEEPSKSTESESR
jgi:hypothetical protein